MVFFTSITANYIPKARILAKSVRKYCPGNKFVLVISDIMPLDFPCKEDPFDFIWRPEELGFTVLNLTSWIFSHTVVELCTAVKGQAILKIFDDLKEDKAIYLDPDIVVLDDLSELMGLLDRHSILLTPHQVVPDTTYESIVDNEVCSLAHGIYNLGFLAVRDTDEGRRFVAWWRDRLNDFCFDDIAHGIFTDQRWIDLVPAFFEDFKIIRDKQYNVATWNLSHRTVEQDDRGKLFIEGKPIRFYHFSGFDSGDQEIMLKKYGRNNEGLFKLRSWYIEQMENEGQSLLGTVPSCYAYFSNGELIGKEHRLLYRSRKDLQAAFPNPFLAESGKVNYYDWFNSEKAVQRVSGGKRRFEMISRRCGSP